MTRNAAKHDALLDELLKDYTGPQDILGEHGLLRQLTKRPVERALEAELTDHLGYAPHARNGRGSGNCRNGKGTKTVQTETAQFDIDVPRDRDGSFEPQLVQKRQRRLDGFDEKVLVLYARGLSTREIQAHLEELYGVEVSPTLISNVDRRRPRRPICTRSMRQPPWLKRNMRWSALPSAGIPSTRRSARVGSPTGTA